MPESSVDPDRFRDRVALPSGPAVAPVAFQRRVCARPGARLLVLAVLAGGPCGAIAAPATGPERVTAIVDGHATKNFPLTSNGILSVELPLAARGVSLRLVSTDVFTEDAVIREIGSSVRMLRRPDPVYYVGSVLGEPESRVFVMLTDDGIEGLIETGNDRLFVEPARRKDRDARPNELLVSRLDEFSSDPVRCFTPSAATVDSGAAFRATLAKLLDHLLPENAFAIPIPSGTLKLARLAMTADYPYIQLANGDTSVVAKHLGLILLVADDTYLREVGVSLRIAKLDMFTTLAASNAVFPAGIDFSTYASKCQQFRISQGHSASGYAVTQCNTANNYNGGVSTAVGFCAPGASNVVTAIAGPSLPSGSYFDQQVRLTAHEIAHNFGSPHLTETTCDPLTLPLKRCAGIDAACAVNTDCASSSCPSNHRCPITNAYCATGSSCAPVCGPNLLDTGYVMWPVLNYPFVGQPLGACAVQKMTARILQGSTPACLLPIACGDVNRNGTVTASDALSALQLSACASDCRYDGLADVYPSGAPSGTVTQGDADLILSVAVGASTVSICGNYPTPGGP